MLKSSLKRLTAFYNTLDSYTAVEKRMQPAAWVLLALACILYAWFQTSMILEIDGARLIPVEPDDSYSYILRAQQMQSCFLQHCQALEDIRAQAEAIPDPTTMNRDIHRVLVVYYPLHSAILLGIKSTGITWEAAYHWLRILGSLFIGGSFVYFLVAVGGAGVAAMTMLLLATSIFPAQGIHYPIPSNLAFALGLIGLALVFNERKRSSYYWLPICALLMVGMHTSVGVFWNGIILLLYAFFERKKLLQRNLQAWLKGCLIAAPTLLFILLSHTLNYPVLNSPIAGSFDLRSFSENLAMYVTYFSSWNKDYGGVIIVAAILVSLVIQRSPWRLNTWLLSGICIFIVATSLFYLVPGYPFVLGERTWIYLCLAAFLLTAHLIWNAALAAFSLYEKLIKKTLFPISWHSAAAILLAVVGVITAANTGLSIYRHAQSNRKNAIKTAVNTKNIWLDPQQPAMVLEDQPCWAIIYGHEIVREYFLTQGALECGAVVYTKIKDTSLAQTWMNENENIRYAAFRNPMVTIKQAKHGAILLKNKDWFEFTGLYSYSGSRLQLKVQNNSSEPTLLKWQVGKEGELTPLSVPAGWSDWISIPLSGVRGTDQTLRVYLSQSDLNELLVSGMRIEGSKMNWPWDSGVAFTAHLSNEERTVQFDTGAILPQLKLFTWEIVADKGYSFLAKAVPIEKAQ